MKKNINDALNSLMLENPCCELRTISVKNLPQREQDFFIRYMPSAKTALVLGHHITSKEEWTWYAIDIDGEYSKSDNHCLQVCNQIVTKLEEIGYLCKIVPYPGEGGLQFRFVAQAAGLGRIGINAFLLHPDWGPWIHLRVLATEAFVELKTQKIAEICNNCGACISACPANAIDEKNFNGLRCRAFRKSKGEYIPFGMERKFNYCEICADVCPIGPKPD